MIWTEYSSVILSSRKNHARTEALSFGFRVFLKNLLNYSAVSSFEAAASEKSTYNDSLHYQAGLVTGPIQIAFLFKELSCYILHCNISR